MNLVRDENAMTLAARIARSPLGEMRRRLRILRYRRLQRRLAGPRLLRAFAHAYPEAFFVEIGSNDGKQHDHLSQFIASRSWSGIMVEPVPYVFEQLRRNYGSLPLVELENVAIADEDGKMPFFHLREARPEERDALPNWYHGLGSFSRDAILGHRTHIPDIESRLVQIRVPCLTYESLLRRHGVDHVDLLLIDTEGYDWEILRRIDLSADAPTLIVYEHYHLPSDVRQKSRNHLETLGYETMEEGFDTFCIRPGDSRPLTKTWTHLRPAVNGVYAERDRNGRGR